MYRSFIRPVTFAALLSVVVFAGSASAVQAQVQLSNQNQSIQAQIQTLMQLIVELQKQIEAMRNAEGAAGDVSVVLEESDGAKDTPGQSLENNKDPKRNFIGFLYSCVLDREPGMEEVKYWQDRVAKKISLTDLYRGFLGSEEFIGRTLGDEAYVGLLYECVLQREGEEGGVGYWLERLTSSALSRDQVRESFLASTEFVTRVGKETASYLKIPLSE